jgi:aspartate/methionine/tyrosine aminotransferase
MIKVNQNIQNLKPSATLAINQKVGILRSKNKDIYHFGFGQSPFPIHESIVKALRTNAPNNNYLPTLGLDSLRITIAKYLKNFQDVKADSDFIYIGPGSKELLYQTMLVLESTFLIPKGSWVSHGPQINSTNGSYVILETDLENSFKLSSKTLKVYCEANPNQQKALILNSPNNPTGAVYTNIELESLAEVCRENNIIVLSDEIYSQVNFTEDFSPSISKFYPEKTIVFGGLSKVFSAGGYRLGFMALPKELHFLHNTYRSIFSETFSAVSSPIQYAAIKAFKMEGDIKNYIIDCSIILKEVSTYIALKLKQANIECTNSQGAFYMMIGFNNFKDQINALGIYTSEQLANYLLNNFKTALLPASDFYFKEEELFFRMAFVDFNGEEVLNAYRKNSFINSKFIENYCPNIFGGVNKIIEFVKKLS